MKGRGPDLGSNAKREVIAAQCHGFAPQQADLFLRIAAIAAFETRRVHADVVQHLVGVDAACLHRPHDGQDPPGQSGFGFRFSHPTLIILSLNEERSEEHTSELQSLMRISYAVFCLKKKNKKS